MNLNWRERVCLLRARDFCAHLFAVLLRHALMAFQCCGARRECERARKDCHSIGYCFAIRHSGCVCNIHSRHSIVFGRSRILRSSVRSIQFRCANSLESSRVDSDEAARAASKSNLHSVTRRQRRRGDINSPSRESIDTRDRCYLRCVALRRCRSNFVALLSRARARATCHQRCHYRHYCRRDAHMRKRMENCLNH